jgi:hypothetical protein
MRLSLIAKPAVLKYAPPRVRTRTAVKVVASLVDDLPVLPPRYPIPPPDPLLMVAAALSGAPYGRFVEFAGAIGADPASLWRWAGDYIRGEQNHVGTRIDE